MSTNSNALPVVKFSTAVFSTPATAAAYGYSSSGIYSGALLGGAAQIVISNGQVGVIHAAGAGSNNGVFTTQVFVRTDLEDSTGKGDIAYWLEYAGLMTWTLSTMTGVTSSNVLGTGLLVADTLVWAPATTGTTPSGNYTDLCTSLGVTTGQQSSPANNTPASLILASLGEGTTLVLDPKLGASCTSMQLYTQANLL